MPSKTGAALAVLMAIATGGIGAAQEARPQDIPIEAFARLPAISQVRISPDGTHLAYLMPVEGRNALIIHPLGGQPVLIPHREDFDFNWFRWATDTRIVLSVYFAGRRITTDTIETRLIAIDRDGKNPELIIRPAKRELSSSRLSNEYLPPPQIQDQVVDWLRDDPDHILVTIDEDHDGESEIRRVNIRDGSYRNIREDRRGVQNWLLDNQGEIRLGWGYDGSRFLISIKMPDGAWIDANTTGWSKDGHEPVSFDTDPRFLFVRGPNEHGLAALKRVDLDSGAIVETVFSSDRADVGGVVGDPLTGRPVGVAWNEDGPARWYFDAEMRSLQASIDKVLPDTANIISGMSENRRKIVVESSSDVDAGVFYLWDRDAGTISEIGVVMPGLPPELMSPTRRAVYRARDGLEIEGWLTLPVSAPQARNLPTVLLPHGGPHARTVKDFDWLRQFLASRGLAVFEPNFRGSTGRGKAFEAAGQREWGGKMQDDLTDAAEWLIEQGIADAERLCIVGGSYGGYAAAMAAVKTPDLFACAVGFNGVYDLPALILSDKDYIGGTAWTRSMGLGEENAKTVSPRHRASEIGIPMLLVHARDDVRVDFRQARDFARALEKSGKEVRLVELERGGHTLDDATARQTLLTALETFLAEHLASPERQAQR